MYNNCAKFGRNIICYEKAISSDFGTVNFGGGGSVGYKIDENFDLQVDSINLHEFIYYNNLEKPTYLKIDIEGSEYTFFEEKVTNDKFFSTVKNIFLEFHHNDGKNLNNIIDRCKKLGYHLTCDDENCVNNNVGFLLFTKL